MNLMVDAHQFQELRPAPSSALLTATAGSLAGRQNCQDGISAGL